MVDFYASLVGIYEVLETKLNEELLIDNGK